MAKLVFSLILVLFALLLIVQSSLSELSPEEAPLQNINTVRQRRKRVRCRDPSCHCRIRHTCPPGCKGCDCPGSVCQDARFVGRDGRAFYFHGQKDADFCLASDTDFHINAHFIGKPSPNVTRDLSWVGSIGAIFGSHNLLVAARRAAVWDAKIDHLSLALDDIPVNLPTVKGFTWRSPAMPHVSFTRTGPANVVAVEVEGLFGVNAAVVPVTVDESQVRGYNVTGDDCFAHLELGFKFHNISRAVDGVLGQTYRPGYTSGARAGMAMPIMGSTNKFLSSGLFATDCAVSRFRKNKPSDNVDNSKVEPPHRSVQCTSMEKNGVLCN